MITFSQWLMQEGSAQDLQQIMNQIRQANQLMYDAYSQIEQKATTQQGQQLLQVVKQGWDATLAAQRHIQSLSSSLSTGQPPVAQVQQPQQPGTQQPGTQQPGTQQPGTQQPQQPGAGPLRLPNGMLPPPPVPGTANTQITQPPPPPGVPPQKQKPKWGG